jgi:hypothetical protein
MYTTSFTVKVYNNYAVGYICQDIVNYYYSLIPKYYYAARQKHPAHVTIIRKDIEFGNLEKYDGYRGLLEYDPYCNIDNNYIWLNAYSTDIGKIRQSVGLPEYRYPFTSYHITVGNFK